VVGGSLGLSGAPSLTSEAALRAGAGVVTACVPTSLNAIFEARLLEVMTRPCPDEDGTMTPEAADTVLAAAGRAGAVALGPGLGRTEGSRALAGELLDRLDVPVVLDADGLWALAGHLDWVFRRDVPTVLTPHAGELGRLLGVPYAEVDDDRFGAVARAVELTGAVVLLKGRYTIVGAPGALPVVSPTGGPALATGGSGDVLSGVIAALCCELPPREAAFVGAYLHGAAADAWSLARNAADRGLLAHEIGDQLPAVLGGLR
jgi:NAD(P)H-hydrate epimerase